MAKYSGLFKTAAKVDPLEPGTEIFDPETFEGEQGFNLLFVDDEEGVLHSLRRIFLEENYQIFTASSGDKALAIMEKAKVHLVISDHRMPGMTGAELLKEIKLKWPETIRIMLTGYADVQSIMGAVKEGAVYKFITKPWNDEDLRLTVSLALQQFVLMQENRKLKEISRKQQLKLNSYAGFIDENRGQLGIILLKAGEINKEELATAQNNKKKDESIGESLVRLGLTKEERIVKILQQHLNIGSVDLKEVNLPQSTVRFLPRELCEKNRMIPVRLDGRQIYLAMADPSDIYKLDNISLMTGLKVVPLAAPGADILEQLHKVYGDGPVDAFETIDDFSDLEPLDEIDIVLDETLGSGFWESMKVGEQIEGDVVTKVEPVIVKNASLLGYMVELDTRAAPHCEATERAKAH